MAKVQVTKTWTVTPNIRNTFVSLVDTMGWWLYQNKFAMKTAGWTVKFSSDGVTGPSGAGDTTDRWASAANCQVRATIAAAAQSWIVLVNADGVQMLFTYQGASADIARISMSQGGLFTLAGTTTQQPTATDECVFLSATSIITATASADRVMSIGCTTEQWWSACFRAGVVTMYASIEKIDSACDTIVLAKPYVVVSCTNLTCNTGGDNFAPTGTSVTSTHDGHSPAGATNYRGPTTRVVTSGTNRQIRVGGGARAAPSGPVTYAGCYGPGNYGSISNANNGNTVVTPPALNNGNIPVLTIDWFGEKTSLMDGYLGSPIDFWYGHTGNISLPATGDMIAALAPGDTQATALRTNWLVAIGSGIIRPWLNVAASLTTT